MDEGRQMPTGTGCTTNDNTHGMKFKTKSFIKTALVILKKLKSGVTFYKIADMKTIMISTVFYFFSIAILSCNTQPAPDGNRSAIDSLNKIINQLKPGLGEFMLQIKYHHDSLGKAILEKDYERAAYEVDEIKETTEKIQQLNITNDKLQKPFSIFYDKYLQAPLNVLADAASKKDDAALKTNFISLTNNCNSCHHENNMAFMKIGL